MVDAFDLSELDTVEKADMVIDFSHRDNLGWIIDYVRKTTVRWSTEQPVWTRNRRTSSMSCQKHPVFYSANFSYGVAVLQETCKTAVPMLKDTFDMELVETHHNQKEGCAKRHGQGTA